MYIKLAKNFQKLYVNCYLLVVHHKLHTVLLWLGLIQYLLSPAGIYSFDMIPEFSQAATHLQNNLVPAKRMRVNSVTHWYRYGWLPYNWIFESSRSIATKEFFVVCEFVDMCTGNLFLYMQVIKSCTIMYNIQSGLTWCIC